MFVYTPIEYYMLLEFIANCQQINKKSPLITPAQIELLALHTGHPAFKTVTFRKTLVEYKKYGMYPPKKADWTIREALHYARNSYMTYKELKECERILS